MKKEQLEKILQNAVGSYENYCDGYFSSYPNIKKGNYICAITLLTAKVPRKFYHAGSEKLDEINAFDSAEANDAYIGQLNLISVTSFCGPMGAIWGYDLAKPDELKTPIKECPQIEAYDGKQIPVYSAEPLIKAARLLFGTKEELHFPIMPGALVPHAGKSIEKSGPTRLYCGIGIGIPDDRERAAVLWMEDIGIFPCEKERILESLAKSVMEVGHTQNVKYKEIFVGVKDTGEINKDEIGCAFVAVPYIALARRAVPKNDINKLMEINLEDWEKEIKSYFLCNTREK
jgi:histidine decarboxylase